MVKIGSYDFDPANQLLSMGSSSKRLTFKENRILRLLSDSKNNLVKREEIMIAIWGESDYYTGRSLDVFISKLRSYLKNDKEVIITTIPTVGYILEISNDN
jgi:DNA-binding response OmpR family regulator